MDRRSRPGPEPTTLEAVGDQWRYALVVLQAEDDDDDDDDCDTVGWATGRASGLQKKLGVGFVADNCLTGPLHILWLQLSPPPPPSLAPKKS